MSNRMIAYLLGIAMVGLFWLEEAQILSPPFFYVAIGVGVIGWIFAILPKSQLSTKEKQEHPGVGEESDK